MYTETLSPKRHIELEAFRKELFDAYTKYNFSISHEDGHGGFIIECDMPSNREWLDSAFQTAFNSETTNTHNPLNGHICPACKGSRWLPKGYTVKGKGYGQKPCERCNGMGTIPHDETVQIAPSRHKVPLTPEQLEKLQKRLTELQT